MNTGSFYLLLLACLIIGCTLAVDSNEGEKADLLIELEKFNQAFRAGDVEVLQSMITNDYIHTNGSSAPIGKTDWINYMIKRREDMKSGKLVVTEYRMDETQIEIYGHVAIVSACIFTTTIVDGNKEDRTYRVTSVWVNDSGSWKRAGFHDGRIEASTMPS